jgi:hypothetical protein
MAGYVFSGYGIARLEVNAAKMIDIETTVIPMNLIISLLSQA